MEFNSSLNYGQVEKLIPLDLLNRIAVSIVPLEPIIALIFGSSVTKGLEANDIDLIVVSAAFQTKMWQDRKNLIQLPSEYKFDLFLFTQLEFEDLRKTDWPFFRDIYSNVIDLKVFL